MTSCSAARRSSTGTGTLRSNRSRMAPRMAASTRPPTPDAQLRRPVIVWGSLGFTLLHRRVLALGGAGVDLPRPRDLLLGILQHLLPLRQPARRARDGEQHREHVERKADRLIDEARIEIDVRVQL